VFSSLSLSLSLSLTLSLWWDWDFNLGLHICKAGALPLEPPVHFALVILEMGVVSHKLFAWGGLKPRSSLSQSPK
jgi:hypothetical protein